MRAFSCAQFQGGRSIFEPETEKIAFERRSAVSNTPHVSSAPRQYEAIVFRLHPTYASKRLRELEKAMIGRSNIRKFDRTMIGRSSAVIIVFDDRVSKQKVTKRFGILAPVAASILPFAGAATIRRVCRDHRDRFLHRVGNDDGA
jgi:hypothetical protein